MPAPRDEHGSSFLTGLWLSLAVASTSPDGPRSVDVADLDPRTRVAARRAPASARRATPDEIEHWCARELRALPGIGPKRAAAIVWARHADAAVGAPATWTRIPGIGESTIERVEQAWQHVRALRLSRPPLEAYTSPGP